MHGYPKFLGQFDSMNNRLKESGSWGSYFQRLAAGKYSGQRHIEVIINKMRKQLSKESGAFGRIYEWSAPLYDPSLDLWPRSQTTVLKSYLVQTDRKDFFACDCDLPQPLLQTQSCLEI